MDLQDIKKKGISGVFWSLFGKVSTHIVTFIVSIILARLLSPADFGLVGMAMVFVFFTQTFMDFGLTSAVIQKKDPTETQINTVFYISIILGTCLMIAMIILAPYIGRYYNNPEVAKIARFVSYSFVIHALTGLQRALLTKQLEMKVLMGINIIGAFVQGVSGVVLAYLGYGAWSIVYSTFLNNIITTLILWIKSSWRPKWLFNLSEIKGMFMYSYKMFIAGVLNSVYAKLDELIIGKMFSPTALGYYYRSKSFNNMIVAYTSEGLSSMFFPVISHLQDDIDQIRKIVVKSLEIICFTVFALMALLYLDAESLIVILFGDKWFPSVGYFKVLVFISYAYPVSVVLVNILSGMGHSGKFLKLEIWKKVIGLSGMFIGFLWGIYGYLWATVVTTAIGVTFNMFFVSKVIPLKISEQWKILIKYALISLGCVIPVWLLNQLLPHNLWLILIVDTLLFSILYIAVNLSIKTSGFLLLKNIIISKNIGTRLFKFKKGK